MTEAFVNEGQRDPKPTPSRFPITNWNWVAQLRDGSAEVSDRALSLLCSGYWYPVYAYLRGRNYPPHEAEDLTQGFFERMLQYGSFAKADQNKGRLRSYLLTCLKRFVTAEYLAARTPKRGGGSAHLPIHLAWAEDRWNREPHELTHTDSPDCEFNRRWWALVTEQALHRVRTDYASRGDDALFDALLPHLDSRPEVGTYQGIAKDLCTTEQALRVALFRLRKRAAEAVRAVLHETVDDPATLEAELAAILGR